MWKKKIYIIKSDIYLMSTKKNILIDRMLTFRFLRDEAKGSLLTLETAVGKTISSQVPLVAVLELLVVLLSSWMRSL